MEFTINELQHKLELHQKWLNDELGGERLVLINADLSNAALSNADLRYADLRYAHLSNADLRYADLRYADLRYADLSNADLSNADLRYADLRYADLRYADLSKCQGVLSAIDYLADNFEKTDEGYIAYKVFGGSYQPPSSWEIKPGSVISENINGLRTNECGCGISVAPLEWVRRNYNNEIKRGCPLYKVLIRWEWLAGVCVPYNTDGKIRCERVELLEVLD